MNQITASQNETIREIKASQVHMEEQITKLTENVRLPTVEEWVRAIEKPLVAQTNKVIRNAQKQGIEDALQRWSKRILQREEKRWQDLFVMLGKDRAGIQKQNLQEEKFRRNLIKTLREDREAQLELYRRDEKRWLNLAETLKQNRKATQKEFREVVQKLSEERDKALDKARQLEEERERDVTKLLDQAKKIEQERKRQMSEFCARRPESAICR
ncbi:MAG: hypothetical protein O7G28_03070 [Deltaproteobacteria bacterium]|nr:hypothetical protein [Deltaproteobacteria bacterium]